MTAWLWRRVEDAADILNALLFATVPAHVERGQKAAAAFSCLVCEQDPCVCGEESGQGVGNDVGYGTETSSGATLSSDPRDQEYAEFCFGIVPLDSSVAVSQRTDGPEADDTVPPAPASGHPLLFGIGEVSDAGLYKAAAQVIEDWEPQVMRGGKRAVWVAELIAALRERADLFNPPK